ncbi:MAG: ATP-dependent sacrificial sulfur transferase LarE [Candidatus Micrarchaeota archaeon]
MYSKKTKKLVEYLSRISPVAVALSGGLDSSVIAKASGLTSKDSVAITLDDYTLPRIDLKDAKRTAKLSRIKHIVLKSRPPPKVLSNPDDRCFYCKKHTYTLVMKRARKFGIRAVVDGANADDTSEYRPGLRAAKELGVYSPLLDLGFGKADTRMIAKEFKLPVWNKPSSACMSSRIPHGERITKGRLSRAETAEGYLRKATGIQKIRVRSHGNLARIEVPKEDIPAFFDKLLINRIAKRLRRIGFSHITLDLEGYRPGGK